MITLALFVCLFVTEGGNSFLQMLYGDLDQTTFYAANALASDEVSKGLDGKPPGGLLLGESYVKQSSSLASLHGGLWVTWQWLQPCKENSGERASEVGKCACTCAGGDVEGLGPEAGRESGEVDNKISIRAQP